MDRKELNEAKREAEDSIAAWMLTLELARTRGDFDRAAEAQRELRDRGVTIRYSQPKKRGAVDA